MVAEIRATVYVCLVTVGLAAFVHCFWEVGHVSVPLIPAESCDLSLHVRYGKSLGDTRVEGVNETIDEIESVSERLSELWREAEDVKEFQESLYCALLCASVSNGEPFCANPSRRLQCTLYQSCTRLEFTNPTKRTKRMLIEPFQGRGWPPI